MDRSDLSAETGMVFRPPPTPTSDLDSALEVLSRKSQEWADCPIEDRISIVTNIQKGFSKVSDRWTQHSMEAKGISDGRTGNDKEWLELAVMNRIHTVTLRTLQEIQRFGKPKKPGTYRTQSNGQVSARVYPDSIAHGLAFRGITIDVILEHGVPKSEAISQQAANYKSQNREGKVALVLGAGNASSLPSSDTFHKLFHDLRVVILKMNPVNAYLGPLLEEGYAPLIEKGYLRIVYGGPDEGHYLVNHDLVNEIHMTGSDRNFDAIVFGTGSEGKRRKELKQPLLTKPIEGELGCITPWVIVPGEWKTRDISEQAAKLAFWMMRHEGYLCFAPRLVLVHKSWPQKHQFVDALKEALSHVEPIRAYYPGSADTQKAFVAQHPDAIQIGGDDHDHVPWTIIPHLDCSNGDDICFHQESFSGMCGVVPIDAPSIPDYLDTAVQFLNTSVWGTLSATLVARKKDVSSPEVKESFERAIQNLKYGTIGINGPGTWGFYTMIAPWGGFPGSDMFDVQSGTAKVANLLMLHRPEKTIVLGPSFWKLPGLLRSARHTEK
jgi:acyl-CoA reductase-like NAD-dependent aldehyde dehydrogenase